MALDQNVVVTSPVGVFRVLSDTNLSVATRKTNHKGTRFSQPNSPHHHWYIDSAYVVPQKYKSAELVVI